ncbi:hypothetical protein HYH02_014690, partial [Chlamydomonas schloesseri]
MQLLHGGCQTGGCGKPPSPRPPRPPPPVPPTPPVPFPPPPPPFPDNPGGGCLCLGTPPATYDPFAQLTFPLTLSGTSTAVGSLRVRLVNTGSSQAALQMTTSLATSPTPYYFGYSASKFTLKLGVAPAPLADPGQCPNTFQVLTMPDSSISGASVIAQLDISNLVPDCS